eukprot:Phypoly_transcript_07116.p1 GENE.Phypoly_transcript_07116~~Phypoly_transcript_07116.p1  ORF type:complete len:415 (+),score=10.89 Phypoly_transcript_07116:84-1328(+)
MHSDLLVNEAADAETESLLEPKPALFLQDFSNELFITRPSPIYLKYYWKIMLLVVAFYGLPSIQFVMFQYYDPEVQCYFNFKCAHSLFGFFAFNNILSNVGYLFAGTAFLLIIRFTTPLEDGIHGLYTDMSLYYCMGLSIIFTGIFSALYHVCPSKLNFQFDTTFMLIGAGLLFIALYQKRHGAIITGAFRAYGFFAAFIFLQFLSLTRIPAAVFWVIVSIVFAHISWSGSAHLYAQRRLSFSKDNVMALLSTFLHPRSVHDKPRFFSLLFANVLSWGIIIIAATGSVRTGVSINFSTVILGVLIINYLVYFFYYVTMKYVHKESVRWFVWVLTVCKFVIWGFAIYVFEIPCTNKFLSFQQSMALNKPCVLFHYFDYHDIWHFLSAFGLMCVMTLVYVLDTDLAKTPRTRIPVF